MNCFREAEEFMLDQRLRTMFKGGGSRSKAGCRGLPCFPWANPVDETPQFPCFPSEFRHPQRKPRCPAPKLSCIPPEFFCPVPPPPSAAQKPPCPPPMLPCEILQMLCPPPPCPPGREPSSSSAPPGREPSSSSAPPGREPSSSSAPPGREPSSSSAPPGPEPSSFSTSQNQNLRDELLKLLCPQPCGPPPCPPPNIPDDILRLLCPSPCPPPPCPPPKIPCNLLDLLCPPPCPPPPCPPPPCPPPCPPRKLPCNILELLCPPPCPPCPPPPPPPCPPSRLPPNFPCPPFSCPGPAYPCCISPETSVCQVENVFKPMGLRYYWLKEMMNTLTIKLNDYVATLVTVKRSRRVRCISEVILRHLCDITGERFTLNTAKTRAQRMMVFVSDRIAMWLAKITCTCDERMREICEKKYDEDEDEDDGDGGGEGDAGGAGTEGKGKRKRKKGGARKKGAQKGSEATEGPDKANNTEEVNEVGEDPAEGEQEDDLEFIGDGERKPLEEKDILKYVKEQNEYRRLLGESYERRISTREKENVDHLLGGLLDEMKNSYSEVRNERADEFSLVVNENIGKKLSSGDENVPDIMIKKLSECIGLWMDRMVTEAEQDFLDNILPDGKKDKLKYNIRHFFGEQQLIEQICAGSKPEKDNRNDDDAEEEDSRKQETEVKSWSGDNKLFDANVNRVFESTVQYHTVTNEQENYTTETLRKLTNGEKSDDLLKKLWLDIQNHGTQWEQNKFHLMEAAKIWKSKMQHDSE